MANTPILTQVQSQKKSGDGTNKMLPVIDEYIFHPQNGDRTIYKCKNCNVKITITKYHIVNEVIYFDKFEYKNDNETKHDHLPQIKTNYNHEIHKILEAGTNILLPTTKLLDQYETIILTDKRRRTTIKRTINRLKSELIKDKLDELLTSDKYYIEEDENIFLLISKKKVNELKDRTIIYLCMDGTFSSCPSDYAQLYTIHVILQNGQSYTLAHCLMSKKREIDYKILFDTINTFLETVWGHTLINNNVSVMVDFEEAYINALTKLGCYIHGCYFHYTQCIWRCVQRCGLSMYYTPNSVVWEIVNKLKLLAFYKQSEIEKRFYEIKEESTFQEKTIDNIKTLIDYYEKNWILGWPVLLWCQFNQMIRTVNLSESYHSAPVKRISCIKPTLPKLLINLMKIEDNELKKLDQMDRGNNHFINRLTRIYNLTLNYYSKSSPKSYFESNLLEEIDSYNWNNLYEINDEENAPTIDRKVIKTKPIDENYIGIIKDKLKEMEFTPSIVRTKNVEIIQKVKIKKNSWWN
ncbi:hypothetical protein EIN_324580 [Entamoeba invadens IP1]|uniref:MULE transposase domain-containing protein n=1 Tax=Entamoeba invadens IP1 TaxID=370355 RepID=L7FNX9_ENTIV|nr:hypothetical protein EIN_324580 [Entamoeba invadens IP1]ELP92510.1 hypothetical protein EIN_324580 [Entamoeba invadens IP1]|eukprot:XP_004259281.1 hypothetical protein EIN_324580 [Entamoeba invadens IP1]